jgi:hypothetical protein
MAASGAMPARRHRMFAGWGVPLGLGTIFGFYAGFLRRTGGPLTWWDVLYGVVAGLVFTLVAYGLGRIRGALPRELRAMAYGALCGMAIGFLHSLTGASVLWSAWLGVVFAVITAVASFYVFYTRED